MVASKKTKHNKSQIQRHF